MIVEIKQESALTLLQGCEEPFDFRLENGSLRMYIDGEATENYMRLFSDGEWRFYINTEL